MQITIGLFDDQNTACIYGNGTPIGQITFGKENKRGTKDAPAVEWNRARFGPNLQECPDLYAWTNLRDLITELDLYKGVIQAYVESGYTLWQLALEPEDN